MMRAFNVFPSLGLIPSFLCFVLFLSIEVLATSPASKDSGHQQQDLFARGGTSQQALSAHNSARAKHGASPLTWDSKLASYAASKASSCNFQHSGGSYGENLAAGTSMSYQSAVDMWMAESKSYHSGDAFSSSAGHFTQVVWKGSKRLGCALITTCSDSQLGFGRRRSLDDGGKTIDGSFPKGATGIILRDEQDDSSDEEIDQREAAESGKFILRKRNAKHGHAHYHRKHKHHKSHHPHKNIGTHHHAVKQHHQVKSSHRSGSTWHGFGGYYFPPWGSNDGGHGGSEPTPDVGGNGGGSGGGSGSGGGEGGSGYVMCEYDPPGNVEGEFASNVEL
ncbi:unnamed protein product [Tilletia controversa]|nr:unnamed protein product [Tilletia controversa]CAD6927325.1 unnamed protein product [Tilletia controversa]